MNPPIIITVECAGTAGQYLPSNAKVSDHEGSVYEHVGEIKLFPEDGHSIVLPFVSHHPHPINLPGEVAIYEACPGWDFAKLISADWPDSVRPRRKLIIPTQQRKYPGFGPPEVSKAAIPDPSGRDRWSCPARRPGRDRPACAAGGCPWRDKTSGRGQ